MALAACDRKGIFTEAGDVGSVSIPGTFSYKDGCYTLTGAGANLWERTDACFFVWKEVEGDFLLTGNVAFEGEGVNPHRKIGFMIRESLEADARYADIAIHGDGLTSLQYREESGGLTLEKVSAKTSVGATDIRLARVGDRISIRTGDAGSDDAALRIDLPEKCYVGLFICSHEEELRETAYFRNVQFAQDLPAEKGLARISIFCDHIEAVAAQEGISFAEAATRIRDIGFTGADVRVFQRPDELRTLDSLGFSHASAITDIPYAYTDPAPIEDATLSFMQEKGFRTLLLVPGLVPSDFSEADRARIRSQIAAFTDRAAAQGADVLVEDFDNPGSLCYNSALLDSLFAVSPALGLVFDTGNFLFCGEDALSCMEHFRPRVRHVHLKDRVSSTDMTCLPAGTGCIPVSSLVNSLASTGYSGWFTVEQYGSRNMLKDSETAYKQVLAALQSSHPVAGK